MAFDEGLQKDLIRYIPDQVYTDFWSVVKRKACWAKPVDKNVAIVYSPLNGTGLKPVLRTLKESGYTNVTVVKEQEQPDGRFPTCPYPNPEIERPAAGPGIRQAAERRFTAGHRSGLRPLRHCRAGCVRRLPPAFRQ
jgi:phosphoglucomutase